MAAALSVSPAAAGRSTTRCIPAQHRVCTAVAVDRLPRRVGSGRTDEEQHEGRNGLRRLVVVQRYRHGPVDIRPALLGGQQLLGHRGEHRSRSHRVKRDPGSCPFVGDRGAAQPPRQSTLRCRVDGVGGLLVLAGVGLCAGEGELLVAGEQRVDEVGRCWLQRGHRADGDDARRLGLRQSRAEGFEELDDTEVVDRQGLRDRCGNAGTGDDGVDLPVGGGDARLGCGGPPVGGAEVGGDVGVVEIDADDAVSLFCGQLRCRSSDS